MKTLTHPNLRDTSIEVDEADVDAYVAQGWRAPTEPKKAVSPKPTTTTATTTPLLPGEDNKKEAVING